MLERFDIGQVTFTVGAFDDCVSLVERSARLNEPCHYHFTNAYSVALAEENPAYAQLLNSGVNFSDGVPVTWVGRRAFRVPSEQWPRVYGPDVMRALLGGDLRHYLLGGSPQTLASLRVRIMQLYPGSQLAGSASPPFRAMTQVEQAEQDRQIRESGAQLVWVGLGTPKQDWEAARIAESTGLPVLAVGAAFDFIAGTKPQAPVWMQRSGTEWAYRLASEPRRLGKRYLWGNPRFVMAAARKPGLRRGSGLRDES